MIFDIVTKPVPKNPKFMGDLEMRFGGVYAVINKEIYKLQRVPLKDEAGGYGPASVLLVWQRLPACSKKKMELRMSTENTLISVSTDTQKFNKKSIPHIQHIVAAESGQFPVIYQNLLKMTE